MSFRRSLLGLLFGLAVLALVFAEGIGSAADAPAEQKPSPQANRALTPQEERATFCVSKGFRVELVACEPQLADPVAMAFDEDGRIYVAEMPGHPADLGIATGKITSGRIRLLEDRDGDGVYETSTLFAENLRHPTAVMPWKGGLLAGLAPDLVYFEDTNGDGKADRRRSLYTGFDIQNSESLVNSLQWGLDNWVYGCAGTSGGTVRSVEKLDRPALTLHGRGIRFHPDKPGSLEATSGGGQYGLAADDWERWFTAVNNAHLRHIILPDHYLRRNPFLAVSAVTLDIPDHGAACKVYRISPFENWRVERTRRRNEGTFNPGRQFPETELVPGGFITSACSPVVYGADLFPEMYRGNTFVCDPANNLIHRDVLEPHGATFVAKRGDHDCEFLASTNIYFRPVFLSNGPDGGLYVADFYREVIETPDLGSMPEDLRKKLDLKSHSRGRIWRIVPEGAKGVKKPTLSKASSEQLVQHLDHANRWWRLTAQRLLVERQDRAAVPGLEKMVHGAKLSQARAHALWTLEGLGALQDRLIETALKDQTAEVREQALRLAERRLATSARLRAAAAALADDPSPRVRFQLAFTLGETDADEASAALAKVARRDFADPWTRIAVLSSSTRTAPRLLETFLRDQVFTAKATGDNLEMVTQLATVVGARPGDAELGIALMLLRENKNGDASWQLAVLKGLGRGRQQTGRSLSQLLEQPPPEMKKGLESALDFFKDAANRVRDQKASSEKRIDAAQLLGYGPFAVAAPALRSLLESHDSSALQLAAVRALSLHDKPEVAGMLLGSWGSYSPSVRREVLEALFARPDRLAALLEALEQKKVLAGQIELSRQEQLRKLGDATLLGRAQAVLADQTAPERRKVLETYRPALDLKADLMRGKAVFKKTCSTCHRLEGVGVEVGPDLLSALRNKTPESLLVDILDPSREVDPRYINYLVTTKPGRVLSGMIAAETGSSITLRRAEKAEDIVLRSQIEELQATPKSVMPEGLEMQLSKQELADIIAYLQSQAAPK
jgi:putative membrane-bound dehydrogenase-like protein